jgi:tetratricopeptide (TPR) repeat protein
MINILLALGCGIVAVLALYLPGLLKLGEASVPGVLVMFVTYFLLARATFRKVEKIVIEASRDLQSMPPKFDLAINTLQKAYVFGRQQLGVTAQIDTQIGMIYFLQKEFTKALPYLQRAQSFGHWMGSAMLAVVHYKKKDHAAMRKTMDNVVKRARKQSLAWNLYAYLLEQIGDNNGAMKILAEGAKHTKDNERVKEHLLALQNNKRFKMKVYKEQWYQFHLERPPIEQQQIGMGGRAGKIARRGRW